MATSVTTMRGETDSRGGPPKPRDGFRSRPGFILACVGSAVGMGNIWLFPYRVGQFGGAAFFIPYFLCVAFIGFTGVIGEMAFGRAMGTGPLGAFKKALERRGKNFGGLVGLIPVAGSLGIAIGYSVVVGWILRFCWGAITGAVGKMANRLKRLKKCFGVLLIMWQKLRKIGVMTQCSEL